MNRVSDVGDCGTTKVIVIRMILAGKIRSPLRVFFNEVMCLKVCAQAEGNEQYIKQDV